MTEQSLNNKMQRDISIENFAHQNHLYYSTIFDKLQRNQLPFWQINIWALLIPWFWASWRGVWVVFWLALAIDVLAITCLMQGVKFTPLLAEALQNPDANTTLIPRYTSWIETYNLVGWTVLILSLIHI